MFTKVSILGAMYWLNKENMFRVTQILNTPAHRKQEVIQEITSAWQTFWNNSTKARRLYTILPDVAEKTELKLTSTVDFFTS